MSRVSCVPFVMNTLFCASPQLHFHSKAQSDTGRHWHVFLKSGSGAHSAAGWQACSARASRSVRSRQSACEAPLDLMRRFSWTMLKPPIEPLSAAVSSARTVCLVSSEAGPQTRLLAWGVRRVHYWRWRLPNP